MRRLSLILSSTIVLALLAASVASAEAPTRIPWPTENSTLPASICGFAVDVRVISQNETLTIFSDSSVILTGTLKLTLSNTVTGKTITRNVSGPVFVRPNADGSGTETLTGHSFLAFAQGELGPGSAPMLAYTTGPVILQFDKFVGGHIVGYSHTSGTTEDLCRTLA
jgi:hypothetical protein